MSFVKGSIAAERKRSLQLTGASINTKPRKLVWVLTLQQVARHQTGDQEHPLYIKRLVRAFTPLRQLNVVQLPQATHP